MLLIYEIIIIMACCGQNQDEACGWPRGTVRAMLALVIVVLAFMMASAMITMLIVYAQITVAVGIFGTVFTVVSAVTAYYFSTQAANASNKVLRDAAVQVSESKDEIIRHLTDTQDRMLSRRVRGFKRTKKFNDDPLDEINDNNIRMPTIIVE